MPIIIRPITRRLPLEDYDAGLEISGADGQPKTIHVWVNPPRAVLDEIAQLRAQGRETYQALEAAGDDPEKLRAVAVDLAAIGNALAELYARLWSQHADPATHWTADELRELGASETDPALYGWLTSRTIALIRAHREQARKN